MGQALTALLDGGYWHPARETRRWMMDSAEEDICAAIAQLSPQERVVLEQLRHGAMNKSIALSMRISENTVKSHISRIYKKLGVENRTKLVLAMQSLPSSERLPPSQSVNNLETAC